MPPPEKNDKIIRYREHRLTLTKFANTPALAARYAFLSELILLWLDTKDTHSEKMWELLSMYMTQPTKPVHKIGRSPIDNIQNEDLIDSPINDRAKASMQEIMEGFLKDETEDE